MRINKMIIIEKIPAKLRISAIKLRNFASDEKAAKFRCFYCSHVGEISQARWLTSTRFQEFVADYRIDVIITSRKSTGTCKPDHYLKKKHRNDCYNCGEISRQNGAVWLVTFLVLSQHNFVSLANTCISAISLKLSLAC